MSVDGLPRLYTDRPIFVAAKELVRLTEATIQGRLEHPVRLILAGGAAMALYSPTRSSNDVDAIFSHRIILPEVFVSYVSDNGARLALTWDRNYSPVLGLMHPDAEASAIFVAQSPDKKFDMLVLSPLDLAVSKLGRYAENDKNDIQELYESRLISPQMLEARAAEAMLYFVGDLGQVHHNLNLAVKQMGYAVTVSKPDGIAPMACHGFRTDASRLVEDGEGNAPARCLARGQFTGKLFSLSEDKTVAMAFQGGSLVAVYRSDLRAMPELEPYKGKVITMVEREDRVMVRDRDRERGVERK
ncbi:DUF6036 family nucleotidyltransferase [Acidithiobacillus sp. IBUN Pt1247-S3]|uniref:DUF6036 family nucleotidyltransferase n=1 Tax=Acidithiobacillus sp. IBUN Pt1247-S3 TaxID=3166642 RepID=UPI0034E3FF0B